MKPTFAHYIQGALGFVSGGALLVAQSYPQLATPCHIASGLCLLALVNLGLLTPSVLAAATGGSTVSASVNVETSEAKP